MTNRLGPVLAIVITIALVALATWRDAYRHVAVSAVRVERGAATTTREALQLTVASAEARLAARPDNGEAAIELADALIRLQRVNNDASAVIAAERRLRDTLARAPGHYGVQRALGAVLLSQHRFRDAIREAERARAADPRDAWNYGVIGDAYVELGEYDRAFAAFETMGSLRPGPAAYARIAYALELQGDLEGALVEMQRAAVGTTAHDAEGQAWHYAQLGNLLLQLGRVADARREFERAAFTFPKHPYAMIGIARVKISERDYGGALAICQQLLGSAPTPEIAAVVGDLHARLGNSDAAEQLYGQAEQLERDGWASEEPQPQALARLLAERNRKPEEAVRLAEAATRVRRDIFTMDAAAWAYYRAGRLDDARTASDEALRTGTKDPRILYHAAAIRAAQGHHATANQLLAKMPMVETDLLIWPATRELLSRIGNSE